MHQDYYVRELSGTRAKTNFPPQKINITFFQKKIIFSNKFFKKIKKFFNLISFIAFFQKKFFFDRMLANFYFLNQT